MDISGYLSQLTKYLWIESVSS